MKIVAVLITASLILTACGDKESADADTRASDGGQVSLMDEFTTTGELPSVLKEGLSPEEQEELMKQIMPMMDDGLTPEQRLKNLREAAEAGDAEAQNGLGSMYFSGEITSRGADGKLLDRDLETAAEWFSRAAEQGHVEAQFNLGLLYISGEGVSKDAAKALELFAQAAEQGNVDAQNNLGVMYLIGEGTEPDMDKALVWFEKAAAQGNAEAIKNVEALRAAKDQAASDTEN